MYTVNPENYTYIIFAFYFHTESNLVVVPTISTSARASIKPFHVFNSRSSGRPRIIPIKRKINFGITVVRQKRLTYRLRYLAIDDER